MTLHATHPAAWDPACLVCTNEVRWGVTPGRTLPRDDQTVPAPMGAAAMAEAMGSWRNEPLGTAARLAEARLAHQQALGEWLASGNPPNPDPLRPPETDDPWADEDADDVRVAWIGAVLLLLALLVGVVIGFVIGRLSNG